MRALRHIAKSEGRAIIPQTAIFDEFSTLLFSAVTKSTPVIFSQVSPKLEDPANQKLSKWVQRFGRNLLSSVFVKGSLQCAPRYGSKKHFVQSEN